MTPSVSDSDSSGGPDPTEEPTDGAYAAIWLVFGVMAFGGATVNRIQLGPIMDKAQMDSAGWVFEVLLIIGLGLGVLGTVVALFIICLTVGIDMDNETHLHKHAAIGLLAFPFSLWGAWMVGAHSIVF